MAISIMLPPKSTETVVRYKIRNIRKDKLSLPGKAHDKTSSLMKSQNKIKSQGTLLEKNLSRNNVSKTVMSTIESNDKA